PEITVTAGADITEGGTASFTVAADPAPEEPLTVTVTVTQDGDYAAPGTTGERTVTIPTTGSASHTVATNDDDADEEDGSITLTLKAGDDYTVASGKGEASVGVADNDDPTGPEITVTAGADITEGGTASFTVAADPAPEEPLTVTVTVTQDGDYAAPGTTGERTVTIPTTGSASHTVATNDDDADEEDGSITLTLKAGDDYTVASGKGEASVAVTDNDDPTGPEVSVTAGAGITEGGTASFTVTASPAPTSPLTVTVTVTQTGDYGATTGTKTVIIPTGGSKTHTVATTGDSVDEPNGSVKVTVNAGQGYTISTNQGTATVTVTDDDDPPPASARPAITVHPASASEGDDELRFRVTLSEAMDKDLRVTWWTQSTSDPDDRQARRGKDYILYSTTITIAAGETVGYGAVWLEQDNEREGDEKFEVWLANPTGADIAVGEAEMIIIDDD
ncbi:MAG: hypothetical protein OXF44_14695, partial [Anaerolineaceae bacterium]|nr:hypothetical protein [Anaerolineaceae bacterium]